MKLNNIDLNKIHIFGSVMKTGSYKEASKELHLTRSAISQAITTLESQLNKNLFLRKSKRLIPTEDAFVLFQAHKQSEKALTKAFNQINPELETVAGTIRVGSYMEFAQSKLNPLVRNFLKKNPNSQFKFNFSSPSGLRKQLENHKIDMAFSIFPISGIKSISSLKILEEELVLVAHKKWFTQSKTYHQLIECPIIDYFPQHELIYRWVYYHYKKKPKSLNIQVHAATAEVVLDLIQQQAGIGVIPSYILNKKNNKDLTVIKGSSKTLKDHIWLNFYPDQFTNSAHKKFHEEVLKTFIDK